MILINLLPHREMARKRARQVFNTSLGAAAVLGALIAGGVYLWYQGQISGQQDRNTFLTGEIKKLDNEIKEVATLEEEIAALKARQQAVENLQADRNLPVHLMNEAVLQLPDGIYLKNIKQENQNVLLTGVAQSNNLVAQLMRNLDASHWLETPELIDVKAGPAHDGEHVRQFQLTVREARHTPAGGQL